MPKFQSSEYGLFRWGSANHVSWVKGVPVVIGEPLPRLNGSPADALGVPVSGFKLLAPS